MNPAERRKQILQVVVLVVLLGVLGISLTFMLRTVSGVSQPASQPQQAAATPAATPAATASQPAGESDAAVTTVASGLPPEFNPNVFRIYDLDPPKNPFIQEERWYTEELTDGLPGYPELRDSGFLEDMGTGVPELSAMLDENESWQQITMQKVEADQEVNIVADSEDGLIKTRMAYRGQPGRQLDLDWDYRSGVPVSALGDGGWSGVPDNVPGDMPAGDDLFTPPGNGLSVPGMGDIFNGGSAGQYLVCQGVSGQGDNASALILYNEVPRIVQAGDSLPPRFTVDAVTANGVALREVSSNETVWLPIGAQSMISAGAVGGVRAPASAPPAPVAVPTSGG